MSSNYGVPYSPSSTPTYAAPALLALSAHGFRYIRLAWVDYTAVVRYRVLPLPYFQKLVAGDARPPRLDTGAEPPARRGGITVTKLALALVFLNVPSGFSGVGEYVYVPDMDTLRVAPYADDTAMVFGFFEEKVPVPRGLPSARTREPGLGAGLCPRALLKRVEEDAAAAGISFLVGFETEFILLKSTDPIEAVNDAGWSVSRALPSGSVESKTMHEISEALLEAGIEVQMFHAEAAPGQFEVVTGPLTPLLAADVLVCTRETIMNVAASHGLRATLAPRVYKDNCGSAQHIHLSVHTATPAPALGTGPAPTLAPAEAAFLAGVLEHLPALLLLTLPTPASYDRVVDGAWSGGTYVSWGTDNREAPVRLTGAPGAHHFELKLSDGTSNPYLSLAGILGVGLHGIKARTALAIGDCVEGSAAEIGEEGRSKLGITQRVPLNVGDARERFVQDEVLKGVLGEEVVSAYRAVNEELEKALVKEAEKLGGKEGDYMRVMVENY